MVPPAELSVPHFVAPPVLLNLENFSVVVAAIELRISPVAVEVIVPLVFNVVNAPVLAVVAPTVPLILIELTPVKVLFNPRIDAPEIPWIP